MGRTTFVKYSGHDLISRFRFRNCCSKSLSFKHGKQAAKLSAVIVVFSGCVGWLALVYLETWREDSLFCFLSISANITSGIFLADWTCPVWNTGHLKRIPAALQDAPIWIILFFTSRKITISEWIWFQFFERWEMESARKNHLWLTHILKEIRSRFSSSLEFAEWLLLGLLIMFLKMFVDASAALSWFVESTKIFVGRKVCLKFAALTRFWCKNGTASVCYLMQCAMLDGRNNRFFFPWEQMFFLMQIIFTVLPFNMAAVQNLYYEWKFSTAYSVKAKTKLRKWMCNFIPVHQIENKRRLVIVVTKETKEH